MTRHSVRHQEHVQRSVLQLPTGRHPLALVLYCSNASRLPNTARPLTSLAYGSSRIWERAFRGREEPEYGNFLSANLETEHRSQSQLMERKCKTRGRQSRHRRHECCSMRQSVLQSCTLDMGPLFRGRQNKAPPWTCPSGRASPSRRYPPPCSHTPPRTAISGRRQQQQQRVSISSGR